MTAYVIVDVEITDPEEGYEEYKKLSPPAVAAYGGKFVARGGKTEYSKETGHQIDWSFCSSTASRRQRLGSIHQNTVRQKP